MQMNSLHLTQNAAQKIYELLVEENDFDLNLRVYITGGGCSGFQYGFNFDKTIAVDDWVIETKVKTPPASVKLLVDAMSYPYLSEAEIDYREDSNGAQFVIKNPKAKTTCGCGSSFSVEEDSGN
jgi:iron-sulfur cluster insertion protein